MTVFADAAMLDLRSDIRTAEVLKMLVQACDAYEKLRERHRIEIPIDGSSRTVAPPFEEAVDLALELGFTAQAFDLLERSKSRALLDALADHSGIAEDIDPMTIEEDKLWRGLRTTRAAGTEGTPHERLRQLWEASESAATLRERLTEAWNQLVDRHPRLRAHRLAEPVTSAEVLSLLAAHQATGLVEFFVGRSAIHAFTVTTSGIKSSPVISMDEPSFNEFVDLLTADRTDVSEHVIVHPIFARLATVIDNVTDSGGVFVVPHGLLHFAPLHLNAGGNVRSATFLVPSASVLRSTLLRSKPRGGVIVGGDPNGDLPYTRAECDHAARRFATTAVLGDMATEDWLAARLREGARLLHLACHAAFHEHRPERSGLVLAGSEGRPDLVTLDRLAALAWSGAVVVLSACQSGRHHVRYGDELAGLSHTLLAAGATALVASLRPVSDLSTAILTKAVESSQTDPCYLM